jgi:hypothetical protein
MPSRRPWLLAPVCGGTAVIIKYYLERIQVLSQNLGGPHIRRQLRVQLVAVGDHLGDPDRQHVRRARRARRSCSWLTPDEAKVSATPSGFGPNSC